MYERTQDTINRILARDAEQRANQGGTQQVVESVVVATPTGRVWNHNQFPGPLDGQPECKYTLRTTFADGTYHTTPSFDSRS